jgi:hypothetical protein
VASNQSQALISLGLYRFELTVSLDHEDQVVLNKPSRSSQCFLGTL